MLSTVCLTHMRAASQCLRQQAKRNIACSAVLAQKVDDPIQQLFLQKIKEFTEKKAAAGGKITDVPPESAKNLEIELGRLEKQYKAVGVDMTKFPSFKFEDSPLTIESASSKKPEEMEAHELPL